MLATLRWPFVSESYVLTPVPTPQLTYTGQGVAVLAVARTHGGVAADAKVSPTFVVVV